MGRHDVRVPDAAAADAQLPRHAARPELPRERAPADRVRPAARRAVGHLGVGLRVHRSRRQLSVPGVRRAGPRTEARARPTISSIAPYATALASLVAPAAAAENLERLADAGAGRPLRLLRGDRLSARASATPTPAAGRRSRGRRSCAPSSRITRACRSSRSPTSSATTCSSRASTPTRASRRPSCCSRSACRAKRSSPSRVRPRARRRRRRLPVLASRRFRSPHTTQPAHAFPVERPLHRRRVTHAGGGFSTWREPGGHAPARRSDVGRRRALHLPARSVVGRGLVAHLPAGLPGAGRVRRHLRPRQGRRSAGATATSRRSSQVTVSSEDDVEVRRLSITNHGERPREIEVTSYAEIVLAVPRTISRTRRSASCSSRPSTTRRAPGCCSAGGRAAPTKRRSGRSTCSASRAGSAARSSGKPTARASSAADASPANPIALDGRALSGTTGAVLDPIGGAARARPARARRVRARDVRDRRRGGSRRGARAGAQVPRRQRRRRARSRWPSRTCTSRCSTSV